MEALGKCMICGGRCGKTVYVCSRCARENGLGGQMRNWPDWARRLATQHKAARRAEREILASEADAHIDEEWLQELANARLTAGGWPTLADVKLSEVGELAPDETSLTLPYAPYGEREGDSAYRKANDVDRDNCIDFETRSRARRVTETGSVFAHGPHQEATLDGFRLIEMDWFRREHVGADGKLVPARYEKRQVWVRR